MSQDEAEKAAKVVLEPLSDTNQKLSPREVVCMVGVFITPIYDRPADTEDELKEELEFTEKMRKLAESWRLKIVESIKNNP